MSIQSILFVENHSVFARIVVDQFLRDYNVRVVPSLVDAKRLLAKEDFDILLVDYDLDDGKGDELIKYVRGTSDKMFIVAVSAREEGNLALSAAGANAVCPKSQFSSIAVVLESVNHDWK